MLPNIPYFYFFLAPNWDSVPTSTFLATVLAFATETFFIAFKA